MTTRHERHPLHDTEETRTSATRALALATWVGMAACGINAVGDVPSDGGRILADSTQVPPFDASGPGHSHDAGAPDVHHEDHQASADAHFLRDAMRPLDASGPLPDVIIPADVESHPDVMNAPDVVNAPDVRSPPDAHEGGPVTCPATPDCSNSACLAAGYRCVPTPAPGWTFAPSSFGTSASCPSGYGSAHSETVAPDAGAAECSCPSGSVGQMPSCVVGTEDVTVGMNGACEAPLQETSDGNCDSLNLLGPAPAPVSVSLAALPASGGTCTGEVITTKPPFQTSSVTVCTVATAPAQNGCSGDEVCAAPFAALTECVTDSTAGATCPSSYPKAYQVGGSIDDSRACGGSCAYDTPSATCSNAEVKLYSADGCGTVVGTIEANGTCQTTGSAGQGVAAFIYTASTGDVMCGAAVAPSPTPTGSVTVTGASTLCCAP
jgi:hypothetical protein